MLLLGVLNTKVYALNEVQGKSLAGLQGQLQARTTLPGLNHTNKVRAAAISCNVKDYYIPCPPHGSWQLHSRTCTHAHTDTSTYTHFICDIYIHRAICDLVWQEGAYNFYTFLTLKAYSLLSGQYMPVHLHTKDQQHSRIACKTLKEITLSLLMLWTYTVTKSERL